MKLWRRNILFTGVLGICEFVFKRPQVCRLGVDSGTNCFCDQIKLPNYQSKLQKCTDFMAKVQVAGRLWNECVGNTGRASAGWTERYGMRVKTAAPCSGSTYLCQLRVGPSDARVAL
jgi:hypothetical protein